MLLQLFVCLPFLNSFPIALDEPFSIYWAQQDLDVLIQEVNKGNNSPFHFLLLHFWIKIFGISPFSVRLLSVFASLLIIPVLFKLSLKILTKKSSAALIVAFIGSAFFHYHSMEARMYIFFILFYSISLLFLYEMLFESKKRILLLALSFTALLYTHYLGIIVFSTFVVITLFFFRVDRVKNFSKIFVSIILSILFFYPGLQVFLSRLTENSKADTWVPYPHVTELYGNIVKFLNGPVTVVLLLVILALFLFFFKGKPLEIFNKIIKSESKVFIFLCFLVPYLSMYFYSVLFSPIFLDRYLLFTLVPLFISAFILLDNLLPENRLGFYASFIFPIVMIGGMRIIPDNNREPNEIAKYVHENQTEGDCVLIVPPYYDLTFIYHFNQNYFASSKLHLSNIHGENIQSIYNFDEVQNKEQYQRMILVDDNFDFAYPNNQVRERLSEWGKLISEKEFKGGSRVTIYLKE